MDYGRYKWFDHSNMKAKLDKFSEKAKESIRKSMGESYAYRLSLGDDDLEKLIQDNREALELYDEAFEIIDFIVEQLEKINGIEQDIKTVKQILSRMEEK